MLVMEKTVAGPEIASKIGAGLVREDQTGEKTLVTYNEEKLMVDNAKVIRQDIELTRSFIENELERMPKAERRMVPPELRKTRI